MPNPFLVLAGVSTISSLISGRKSSKAQEAANEAQRDINRLRNKQNKRAFMRQFRQAQAAAIQGAVTAGIGIESSAVQGTLSSQAKQALLADHEFKWMDVYGAEMSSQLSKASNYQFQAGVANLVGNFASSFIGSQPPSTTPSPPKEPPKQPPPPA